MISYLLNYVSETELEIYMLIHDKNISVLHLCINHFNCIEGIISQPRDIAQRLNINVPSDFIEIDPELRILEGIICTFSKLYTR
jgi:hypothetical protein